MAHVGLRIFDFGFEKQGFGVGFGMWDVWVEIRNW